MNVILFSSFKRFIDKKVKRPHRWADLHYLGGLKPIDQTVRYDLLKPSYFGF